MASTDSFWDPAHVVEREFVILVSDIRESSVVLSRSHPANAALFFERFAALSQKAITAVGFDADDFRINRFTGDGFLIFFKNQSPDLEYVNRVVNGAVLAAARMNQDFNELCQSTALSDNTNCGFQTLSLGMGIHLGRVFYGRIAGTFTPDPTGIIRNVVFACRLADSAKKQQILLSVEAYHLLPADSPATMNTRAFKGFGRQSFFEIEPYKYMVSPVAAS